MLVVTSIVINACLVLPVLLSLFVMEFECLLAIVLPLVIVVVNLEGNPLIGVVLVVLVVVIVLGFEGYVIPMQIK